MKSALVISILAATLAAAGTASAAAPPTQRIAALERQVKALQAQVKTLRHTVDSNQEETRNELARNRVGVACLALAVADVFQSTWGTTFGPQTALDDVSCKAIGVQRPGIQPRPSVQVFWALTGWLIG
jgi:hypothetical protein